MKLHHSLLILQDNHNNNQKLQKDIYIDLLVNLHKVHLLEVVEYMLDFHNQPMKLYYYIIITLILQIVEMKIKKR